MRLTVSEDRRSLVRRDGEPFFWLADTAWELVHRLNREQIAHYLDNRRRKGFSVVQVVCIGELCGLDQPNAEGELPLVDGDIARPNDRYFDLVRYTIDEACRRDLYIALVPNWGAYAVAPEHPHPFLPSHHLFDPVTGARAYPYGRYLGECFGDCENLIWILGGDYDPPMTGLRTWQEMARGIAEGATGGENYDELTMTFHPRGPGTSATWWHFEPWLTFNMLQTGHDPKLDVAKWVRETYRMRPPKPVLNGEPMYERLPARCSNANAKMTTRHVRWAAYRSVFAGAFGHTYGANELWMMWQPGQKPVADVIGPSLLRADTPWYEALDYPGAAQMGHLRALMQSRPGPRLPDQGLIARADPDAVATRDRATTWAMVYAPHDGHFSLDLKAFGDAELTTTWFDPGTGLCQPAAGPERGSWAPPGDGDWVLMIDRADAGHPVPVERSWRDQA